MELQEINLLLDTLPQEIEDKTEEYNAADADYKRSKAEYEYKYSEVYLNMKALYPDSTQGDLTANAKIHSHALRLAAITSQSIQKKKLKELDKLRDEFDALKEQAANWRAHLKRFGA